MSYKIQLITYPPITIENFAETTLSRFNDFYCLDSFDYNFIRLNINEIINYKTMNKNDFESLKTHLNDNIYCSFTSK